MKKNIKLGLGQILIEGGEPIRNLKRAIKVIKEAKSENCDIILLPECLDLGWTHPSAKKEAETIPGKWSDLISNIANEMNIWVCAGLTEKKENKIYNAAVLFDNSKNIVLKYRKINILSDALSFYNIGNRLNVVDTPFGKIGVNICSDNYIDSLHIGHALARMGAEIILSPSSWTVDYDTIVGKKNSYGEKWIEPYSILAKLYNLVVCATTSVGTIVGGPFEGRKMMGGSLVVNKSGVLLEGEYNEYAGSLSTINIDLYDKITKGTQIGESLKSKGYRFDSISDIS